jgi:signal transduction histidine kinase
MQVQREKSQEEEMQALRRQVDELTATNLLLQEQLARKEQFNAMIAHELRNPVSPIIIYAQMVGRPAQRAETIQRGTKIIVSQARRLVRLVDDLLDNARLSSGQFALVREMCDVVVLTKEIVEQLRPIAPHHTLQVEVPNAPVIGNWDSGRLQQALGNLLDNAIKYSDPETTITVRIITTPDVAHISVHNQGTSIPSAESSELFRPYVRLKGANRQRGSGLGLYITKCIIEAHGGMLRLEPHTAESQGTTFSFDLPLH